MKLNKAIKKENSNNKIFFILMSFLLICLPFVYYLFQRSSSVLIMFLLLLEGLILFSIANRINNSYIKYTLKNNNFIIKDGFLKREVSINCEKIKLIDTVNINSEIEIILISNSKFRNKYLQLIDFRFLNKHTEINEFYNKAKRLYPEEIYYYQVIKRGSLKKYNLISDLFKNCVKAEYTSSAIENIKIARGQEEF